MKCSDVVEEHAATGCLTDFCGYLNDTGVKDYVVILDDLK